MIKLVAVDLDDTLLNSQLQISPTTAQAIRSAIERGVVVTLATGRMYQSALPYALQLGLDVPLITYHGALVKTSLSQEVLYHKTISVELACKIIDLAEEKGFRGINLYLNDELYVTADNPAVEAYTRLARVPFNTVADLRDTLTAGADKIMIIDEEAKLDWLAPLLRETVSNQLHITKSKPHFLEITHPAATKGQALDFLAGKIGIDRSQVMAIGDSYNDLDMLEYAGLGVAMGNARTEIQDKADFVTAKNDADGVAEAIQKFVLG